VLAACHLLHFFWREGVFAHAPILERVGLVAGDHEQPMDPVGVLAIILFHRLYWLIPRRAGG
jgi:hypothetical protein